MTAGDALEIAYKSFMQDIGNNHEREGWHVTSCRDFGDSYGFMFQPEGGELLGLCFQCVDKLSGKVYPFAPQLDMQKFMSSVFVELDKTQND